MHAGRSTRNAAEVLRGYPLAVRHPAAVRQERGRTVSSSRAAVPWVRAEVAIRSAGACLAT
eukprot:6357844-Alexandrium_andersonii.AAC.1